MPTYDLSHVSKHQSKQRNQPKNISIRYDESPDSQMIQRALSDPGPHTLTPDVLRILQNTHGNHFVQRLIQRASDAPISTTTPVQHRTDHLIQPHRIEEFDSYEAAKNANEYSKKHLPKQKNDKISAHFGASFSSTEIENIYTTNKAYYKKLGKKDGEIHADVPDHRTLHKQDTALTPHIDHRYPKSQGGTNSFKNAAVISAASNIKKSDKLDLDKEPAKALAPYKKLSDAGHSVSPSRDFSQKQKDAIYAANIAYNKDGTIKSDDDESVLEGYDSARVPHVDHITPKSDGGTNYYFNAQVMPADENIRKGGAKKRDRDVDWEIGEMSLVEYYKNKLDGQTSSNLLESESSQSSQSSDSSESEEQKPPKRRKLNEEDSSEED